MGMNPVVEISTLTLPIFLFSIITKYKLQINKYVHNLHLFSYNMKVRCCKTLQPHLVLYLYLGLHMPPSRPHEVGNRKVVGVFNKHSFYSI